MSQADSQLLDFKSVREMLPLMKNQVFFIENYTDIERTFDVNEAIKEIQRQYKEEGRIDGKLMITLLFDVIKRKLTFIDIVVSLTVVNENCKLT